VLGAEVRLDRPSIGFALVLAALCALCLAAAPAGAAPALSWSTVKVDRAALTGVSCASDTLCVAVDEEGYALISTDPTAGAGASWSRVEIDGAAALTGVSCASDTLCVAVDEAGNALVSTDPGVASSASWSAALPIDRGNALSSVSCASNTLCVAVDRSGNALLSTDPTAASAGSWPTSRAIDRGHALSSVSCASNALCMAVDDTGRALSSSEPVTGPWHERAIDTLGLASVACSPAPAGVCVAVDAAGDALASGDPTAETPTWSTTPTDTLGAPTSVSCAAAGLCVSVDGGGGAYASDDPAAAGPSWTFDGVDPGTALSGVSCQSEGLCAAVDRSGQAHIAQVPPPIAVGLAPSALGETSATLAGTVSPEDAELVECRFEYGPSAAYGQIAPCAGGELAGGTAQAVSAPVSGLSANTTYHYRLAASSATGTALSEDATFKTSAPPLVQPHPSIQGIPARGQRLTCKSGVSASGVTLAYGWLRDTRAISGASGSGYTVSSADVSHHLQCRVTATNAGGSASASSAFVTVPAGGLGSISETQVGAPRVAGSSVSVPLMCSAQAAGSCRIALRLTVVETLRGGRVIALAARSARRVTVTVGAITVRVPAGQRRTATVALNATGRRLLARVHQLTAKLSVSGTVVGALSASLRSATVTFAAAGKASSHKASRRRR
jgi:hypothetical protein